jgi:septal ring factor EnvC (AmiA/AmiB activator)
VGERNDAPLKAETIDDVRVKHRSTKKETTMACSMIKKGLLGASLGAGALYLAFGTSAPSYVRTAFHKVRDGVQRSTPVPFEIDRARDQIAELEPAIKDNIENLARAQVEVEHLDREIVAIRTNLGTEKKVLTALRSSLDSGDFKLAGNVTYTADEVKTELKHRWDHFQQVSNLLKDKEETLKAKQKAVIAARQQLQQMANAKQALATKLSAIEARLKAIQATKDSNEFNFDDSALARAKASVADLEKRLDVMARTAEMEGRFSDTGIPVIIEPGRDVLKEMDAEFGPPAKTSAGPDKSL